MVLRLDASDPGFEDAFADFLARPRGESGDVRADVEAILSDVRARGGASVADFTAQFDELQIDPVLLTSDNVDLAAMRPVSSLAGAGRRCPRSGSMCRAGGRVIPARF